MLFKQFGDLSLSALGFGTMRLPLIPESGGEIDQAEVDRMVDAAMAAGGNYFDTAYPYHGGKSELAIGKSLARYPRDKWYLADKFPGHQNVKGVRKLEPEVVFEEQLKKCGVEYFDFYLLHNVNENSMAYYGNPENHFIEYFLEQKAKGRIKHLGFSCHAAPEGIEKFLKMYGEHMEFCQIQLNFLDWTLQDAKKKVEMLREAGLPVWVMEPVRGGKLAHFAPAVEEKMKAIRPEDSIASWGFRWLQTVPQPTMVLSGMSNLAQMQDNIKNFSTVKPLNEEELSLLCGVADGLAKLIPCTGCRYCCPGCPMELDIPTIMNLSNDLTVDYNLNIVARYGALGEGKQARDCIGCGQCMEACPQKINVPEMMRDLDERMSKLQTWEQICKDRQDAQDALKK